MSQDDKKQIEQDLFIANTIYPEGEPIFAFRPKPLEAIKDDCYIVFDTNALLVPYTTSKESLEQIRKTCGPLVESKRLIIPGQVAREFAKHRANKITELYQQLSNKRDSAPALKKGTYPLLESSDDYKESLRLEDEINHLLNQYRDAIGKVLNHIESWTWDDPVSQLYCELFSQQVVLDMPFNEDEVKGDLVKRKLHNIPPGYKDANAGDLLIWRTILKIGSERKKSVIFISGDEKTDWFHQSNKQALYPRYELVDEFRRHSEGQTFHIIKFSTFLNLYGASDKVVEEVRKEELQVKSVKLSSDPFIASLYTAKQAVMAWLCRRYADSEVRFYGGTFPDFIINNPNGAKIVVKVEYFQYAHIFLRNYKERAEEISNKLIGGDFSEFYLILVGLNEKSGFALAEGAGLIRLDIPNIKIIVGYITQDGEFSTSIPIYPE